MHILGSLLSSFWTYEWLNQWAIHNYIKTIYTKKRTNIKSLLWQWKKIHCGVQLNKLFAEFLTPHFGQFINLLVEPVNILTSVPFIKALKRFITRRWLWIFNLYYDNGTNSIVANNKIKNMFTEFWGPYFGQFIKLIF